MAPSAADQLAAQKATWFQKYMRKPSKHDKSKDAIFLRMMWPTKGKKGKRFAKCYTCRDGKKSRDKDIDGGEDDDYLPCGCSWKMALIDEVARVAKFYTADGIMKGSQDLRSGGKARNLAVKLFEMEHGELTAKSIYKVYGQKIDLSWWGMSEEDSESSSSDEYDSDD